MNFKNPYLRMRKAWKLSARAFACRLDVFSARAQSYTEETVNICDAIIHSAMQFLPAVVLPSYICSYLKYGG